MTRDIKDEGELHKYMIQAISKPEGLVGWNKAKYDKVEQADRTMRQRKRQRQKLFLQMAKHLGEGEVYVKDQSEKL